MTDKTETRGRKPFAFANKLANVPLRIYPHEADTIKLLADREGISRKTVNDKARSRWNAGVRWILNSHKHKGMKMKYLLNFPFYLGIAFLDLTSKQFFIVLALMICVDVVSHITAKNG